MDIGGCPKGFTNRGDLRFFEPNASMEWSCPTNIEAIVALWATAAALWLIPFVAGMAHFGFGMVNASRRKESLARIMSSRVSRLILMCMTTSLVFFVLGLTRAGWPTDSVIGLDPFPTFIFSLGSLLLFSSAIFMIWVFASVALSGSKFSSQHAEDRRKLFWGKTFGLLATFCFLCASITPVIGLYVVHTSDAVIISFLSFYGAGFIFCGLAQPLTIWIFLGQIRESRKSTAGGGRGNTSKVYLPSRQTAQIHKLAIWLERTQFLLQGTIVFCALIEIVFIAFPILRQTAICYLMACLLLFCPGLVLGTILTVGTFSIDNRATSTTTRSRPGSPGAERTGVVIAVESTTALSSSTTLQAGSDR